MTQTAIPFHFMRGGTSRGPYFRREDLPAEEADLSAVLVKAMGAGHPNNIDGLGVHGAPYALWLPIIVHSPA